MGQHNHIPDQMLLGCCDTWNNCNHFALRGDLALMPLRCKNPWLMRTQWNSGLPSLEPVFWTHCKITDLLFTLLFIECSLSFSQKYHD
jgi:hypothetical protein